MWWAAWLAGTLGGSCLLATTAGVDKEARALWARMREAEEGVSVERADEEQQQGPENQKGQAEQ